jgi:uncharacterized sulfatase
MARITRRSAVQLAAVPLIQTSRTRAAARQRPNILWLSSEDTSPTLGCYGDAYAVTPTLDRLASQGARYSHAFSVYGVCAPSRSSIITGMYPTAIGTCHMRSMGVPPPEVKCFTEYLRAAGYYCANNVKTDYNFDPPATAWDDCSTKAHWRNRPSKDTPFFCVLNDTVTHESQIRATPEQAAKNTSMLTPAQRRDPAKAPVPPYYPNTPTVRQDIARYYETVTALDHHVDRILGDLASDGLAENTAVFYWGDHGWGMTRGKRWPYDSGIRVPLLVRWPGMVKSASVDPRMVSLMDLGPTALSLAGIRPPAYMHGRAFLGEHAAPPRKHVFACRDRMDETPDTIRAVRDSRFKYIRNYRPELPYSQHIVYMDEMPTLREMRSLNAAGKLSGAPALWFAPRKPEEELYDCASDPHEIKNLATDPKHASKLKELRAVHEQWERDYPDLGRLPEPELLDRMRPGGTWQTTAVPQAKTSDGKVELTCATPGASIAYTMESGAKPRWLLYSAPLAAAAGTLRAKACRLGFKDSEEVSVRLA